MSYRSAVLSLALSASIAFTVPLQAQLTQGPRNLLDNINSPGLPDPTISVMAVGAIAGTVSTSDHRPAADARVELHNISTGAISASGYVDRSGAFELKNLPLGSYEVVAMAGISEARQRVRVDAVEISVNLTLPHTATSDPNGAKTVSVSQLRVPEKARKELDKAHEALNKNNVDEARKRIDKALEIEPKYADAFVLRGVLALQNNDAARAGDDFHQALQYDASSAMAYIGTGAVYNMEGRYDDALRELDRGMALNPTSWQAHFEMAKANLGKGDFEAALRHANKAQDLLPSEFFPIHLMRGHALLGMKDYTSAIAEFEAFLSKDGQSPDAPAARQHLQQAKSLVTMATAAKGR